MRKKNSISEFGRERNEFLLRSFRESIAAQSKISLDNAFRQATEKPAPRFWVSEVRASNVIGRMLAGEDPTADMVPEKREMYRELFARFMTLHEENPDASIAQLCYEVVNDEAPRSYMSWHRARVLIYQEISRQRKERREHGRKNL